MRNLRQTIMVASLGAWCVAHAGSVAQTENVETLAEKSQANARALLDRAVDALGGAQALRAIDTIRLRLEGENWPRLQMPTAAPPFASGAQQEMLLLDLKNSRMRLEQKTNGQGFEGNNTVVISGGEGANYDLRARTITPIPVAQSSQQQFVQFYRRVPNLLLRQALDRTNTLRYLGKDTFDGKANEVFTFVMADGQQIAVYVDASTALVSKYELIFVDPLLGEEGSEIVFSDYATVGKYRVPQSWTNKQAGETVLRFKLQTEFNPAVSDADFNVASEGLVRVGPLPNTLPENVEQLAEGVFVIQNVAGQNQNTLAVAFKDYVLAVEAPGSSDGAEAVIARIKETIPNKPIRFIAMTHHHSDHIGGLRSFIAEGAKVITTAGNKKVVEAMAAAPQLDRLAKSPRPVEFLMIEGRKRVLKDSTRTVELIDIGPNPHAAEMVVAYLPKERILFQGDLFFIAPNDAPPGPPQATTVSFAKRLKELNLPVDRIASVHGETATMDQFVAATRGSM